MASMRHLTAWPRLDSYCVQPWECNRSRRTVIQEGMSRQKGTAEELERRRRRAVELSQKGEPHGTIARVLGVHVKSISRWLAQARKPHGLDSRPQPGRRPGLSRRQLATLDRLLRKGAKHHGWHNEPWTAARVA